MELTRHAGAPDQSGALFFKVKRSPRLRNSPSHHPGGIAHTGGFRILKLIVVTTNSENVNIFVVVLINDSVFVTDAARP